MTEIVRVTTDCVIIAPDSRIFVVRRKFEPFQHKLALPGGYVEAGESVPDACRREVEEEAGIKVDRLRLIGVYSDPGRDPRGPVVSVAYMTQVDSFNYAAGLDEVEDAQWTSTHDKLDLAFDHNQILEDAKKIAKSNLWLTTFGGSHVS